MQVNDNFGLNFVRLFLIGCRNETVDYNKVNAMTKNCCKEGAVHCVYEKGVHFNQLMCVFGEIPGDQEEINLPYKQAQKINDQMVGCCEKNNLVADFIYVEKKAALPCK